MTRIIRTAICSFGMSGKLFHAPFLQAHPGFQLAGIVERHREESRERYPDSKLYRSVEEVLKDESIELVVVNTPVQTHFEYARLALLAGKQVIVEKPFTVHSKEGEELVALAKEKGLLLSVYQNRRYDGDFHAVKKVVKEKQIGEVKEAEIRYDRFRPVLTQKLHKESDLPGAGITYDLGAHLIDQALMLFGRPTALFADMMAMRGGSPVDDYMEILFFYPDLRVRLKASCFVKEPVAEYIFNGTHGTFLQKRSDRQEAMLLKGVAPSGSWCPAPEKPDGILNTSFEGKEIRLEQTSQPGNYMGYFENIYQTIVNGAPNPVPGEDGVNIIRLIELAKQSASEGRIISL